MPKGGRKHSSIVVNPPVPVDGGMNTGGGASPSSLTFSDFTYQGMFKLPLSDGHYDFSYTKASMTYRIVGGNLNVIMIGKWAKVGPDGDGVYDPIYEITVPTTASLTSSVSTAPRATFYHNWGDLQDGRNLIYDPESGPAVQGLWLDRDTERLWIAYASHYKTGGFWDPCLICTQLDLDTNSVVASYGPWRGNEPSQMYRGNLFPLPSDWSTTYAGGKKFGIGGPVWSQNTAGPRGSTCFGIPTFDPTTLTPNTGTDYTNIAFNTQRIIYHDHDHPQSRTGVTSPYKICGWAGNTGPACSGPLECSSPTAANPCSPVDCPDGCCYDDTQGDVTVDGDTTFNNSADGINDLAFDVVNGRCWITTPSKQGFICFGDWVDSVSGIDYGPDTIPHQTYGPTQGQLYDGTPTPGLAHCVHQQVMHVGTGTGPKSASVTGFMMIFDPDTMGQAALGNTNPWIEAARVAKLNTVIPAVNEMSGIGYGTYFSACYVPELGLLLVADVDRERPTLDYQAVIHVLSVNQGA